MGRVKTNDVALAYAVEAMLGMAPAAGFRELEPNTIGAFGATISTVARTPISRSRQRRKGSITDLDATVEFEADLTLSAYRDFLPGFMFATIVNADVTDLKVSAVTAADDDYTVTALVAAQAEKFEVGTLIWADGFSTPGNNGLKAVDADAMTGHTVISVGDGLTDESGVANGYISFAGYRTGNATWAYVTASGQATLGLTGIGTALAALGLHVGQFVHIGSIAQAGGVIQNAFGNATSMNEDELYGYARVRTISADAVVFDKLSEALKESDNTAKAVDVLFGEFGRNVEVGGSEYLERSFHLEATYPALGAGLSATPTPTDTEYEYVQGCFANTFGFNLPLTDKATLGLGFVGQDSQIVANSARRGGSTRTKPVHTAAFNTSADIGRIRAPNDPSGDSALFKSLNLTLGNNVSGEKVLGFLGNRLINVGNFDVGLEAQMLFTDRDIISAIRGNETVTMDFVLKNTDGIIAFDLPSMTLGGGGRDYPLNESVLVNITAEAFQDDAFGTSVGASTIPVPLP